jgi:hypothetical protein
MSFVTSISVGFLRGLLCLLVLHGTLGAEELPDFTEALKVAKAADPLSKEEQTLAVRVAETALRSEKLLPDKKTFLASMQSHRDTEAEKKGVFERHALVTYYRYAGDTGLLVYVNLVRQTAKVERSPHFAASIAQEELQRATELAMNHPTLTKVLEPFRGRVTVEALLMQSVGPKDPLFGHRLVNLLFRVGPHYLTASGLVLVDLTTEKVTIIPPPQKEDGPSKH